MARDGRAVYHRTIMLKPSDAWALLEENLRPLGDEIVPRLEATGRCLRRDLEATVDMPQADVSAMDGYIVAGGVGAGAVLEVVGTAAAGRPAEFTVPPGSAAKIMTGAVVPAGGDRVVPIEQTDGGDERVRIDVAPVDGAHIRRGGEVVRRGGPLLAAGTVLTPGAVSLLASHGYAEVPVARRPTVAAMATGDEVVPASAEPAPGQLRDSNTTFLRSAGRTLGLGVESLGIAGDSREALRERIGVGLRSDVLMLCGGVSKGEFDLVEDVLGELGCRRLFDAVAIQPGKPMVASVHGGGWVFGLPGNPASVMVTFWLYVAPFLRRLQGLPDGYWHRPVVAELGAPLPRTKGRDRFLAAEVTFEDGRLIATPLPPAGSHDVVVYGYGNALVRAPKLRPETPRGAACEVLLLGDPLAS